MFLSYRSAEDAYAAALLDLMLSESFGHDNVFRASRSISPGDDYPGTLMKSVESAKIMLVIIGRNWLEPKNGRPHYVSRPDDWMRKEVARALELKIPVLPILLSGAPRLGDAELPGDISRIKYIQYIRFDYRTIDDDYRNIRRAVSAYLGSGSAAPREDANARALSDIVKIVESLDHRRE